MPGVWISRSLPPTGALDDETWKQLKHDTGNQPPVVRYEMTDADIAGPFTPGIPESDRPAIASCWDDLFGGWGA